MPICKTWAWLWQACGIIWYHFCYLGLENRKAFPAKIVAYAFFVIVLWENIQLTLLIPLLWAFVQWNKITSMFRKGCDVNRNRQRHKHIYFIAFIEDSWINFFPVLIFWNFKCSHEFVYAYKEQNLILVAHRNVIYPHRFHRSFIFQLRLSALISVEQK